MKLIFDAGTLLLLDTPPDFVPPLATRQFWQFDARVKAFRARACDYAEIVLDFRASQVEFQDQANNFAPLTTLQLREPIVPRAHQELALQKWSAAGYRGIAALPTGSGKTILAVLAIAQMRRPALILVPTIDLLAQWSEVLSRFFNLPIGMLGGGSHDIQSLTVSTYDSAVLNMEFIGNQFGLLIADECHHLPGPETRLAAAMAIAPYRLGLSATPELPDDRAEVLRELMGDIVCRVHIDQLEGKVLAPYEAKQLEIPLDPDEAERYHYFRDIYTKFIRANRIDFRRPDGWGHFLALAGRSSAGRAAFTAFLEQRRIARGGEAKLRVLWKLLHRHVGERILVFTGDNSAAYEIGRRFVLPVLTHLTPAVERRAMLEAFRSGTYPILVTNRVLNEGVDVPAAAVGIVLAGTGSVREHVQRLGRVLRAAPGKKQAILYELISAGTSEEGVSSRRREHRAYILKAHSGDESC